MPIKCFEFLDESENKIYNFQIKSSTVGPPFMRLIDQEIRPHKLKSHKLKSHKLKHDSYGKNSIRSEATLEFNS